LLGRTGFVPEKETGRPPGTPKRKELPSRKASHDSMVQSGEILKIVIVESHAKR